MKTEAICDPISEQQSDAAENMELVDLLIILLRRRRFIVWFTLGAAILSTVAVLLIPSEYTAETVVVPPGQNSPGSALLGRLGGAAGLASITSANLGIRNPGDMYVSLFRSPTVEDSLIQRFGLAARYQSKKMSDARTKFEERSIMIFGVKDALIRITVTDRDPNSPWCNGLLGVATEVIRFLSK